MLVKWDGAGIDMTKHVGLSVKNLNIIFDWAENNDNLDVCKQYMSICSAIGYFSETSGYALMDVQKAVKGQKQSKSNDVYKAQWWETYNALYRTRDKLGRHILEKLMKNV